MKFVLLLLAMLCLHGLVARRQHKNHPYGFYWDDLQISDFYKAVPGGKDVHNKDTYIGLTKHVSGNKEFLVPGTLYRPEPNTACMLYEWNKTAHIATGDLLVLYSSNLNHMVWLPTNKSDVKQLVNIKKLISAGYNKEHIKYYIGRISLNGRFLSGKVVISKNNKTNGFHALSNSAYLRTDEFEVLVYQMR